MDSKKLREIVERRHPAYKKLQGHWSFLQDCYDGGRSWFDENIHRYFKEGDDEFAARITRGYRFNHTREVVDLIGKYLFRSAITRKQDAPDFVQDFWRKSTQKGLGIEELIRSAEKKASIFGRAWMMIDSKVSPTDGEQDEVTAAVSVRTEDATDKLFAYILSPNDVLDYSWNDDGELNWIKVREHHRNDADPISDDGSVSERFRLWTRTEWLLIGQSSKSKIAKYEVIDSGTHNLGRVPAIPLDNLVSSDNWTCPSTIDDIAYLDRAVTNYASNLDAIIQDQTFSQLAIPAQAQMPGTDMKDQMVAMGTKRIFTYDSEGGVPVFLSPDPRQAGIIVSVMQTIITEIYHSVGLSTEHSNKGSGAKGQDNSSGVAKSRDFARVVALLSSKADALEVIENKIVALVCAWHDETPPKEPLVSYSREFDVRGLDSELDLALRLSALELPPEVTAEQNKLLVEKLLPHLSSEVVKALKVKIDQQAKKQGELKEVMAKLALTPPAPADETNKITEEAKRDREGSGEKQSKSKAQDTAPK